MTVAGWGVDRTYKVLVIGFIICHYRNPYSTASIMESNQGSFRSSVEFKMPWWLPKNCCCTGDVVDIHPFWGGSKKEKKGVKLAESIKAELSLTL